MAYTTALSNASQRLRSAVRAGDLVVLFQSSETLVNLMFDAVSQTRPDDLKVIEKDLANAHAMMLLLNDLEPEMGVTAAAWMLKAKATVASVARRLVPSVPDDCSAASLVDKVLLALKATNQSEVTNSQLAQISASDPANIARALARLREEGLVESRKVGRRVMNRLSEGGRARALELALRGSAGRADLEADRVKQGRVIDALARGEAGQSRISEVNA